jgi:hypothetical protein
MRKQIISESLHAKDTSHPHWLDLEALADVEITSENSDYPIEAALLPRMGQGWRAADPGTQTIRLLFIQPQQINRIQLSFQESTANRTQEYCLRWSQDHGKSYMEITRQQWNFSQDGSTNELEDHAVELDGVTVIELTITPDISGQANFASLDKLRVA